MSGADAAKLVAEGCRKPSDVGVPVTHWSAGLLTLHPQSLNLDFDVSESTFRRILRDADQQPHRQTMWLTSHDDEFRAQGDDVLHVYHDTLPDEQIICLDEMTGVQILERLCPGIPRAPGMPVRREFEYKRHGTLTLMGALDVWQCMFGIIQRRVLRRGSFRCADELIKKMCDCMIWHNQSSHSFGWSYRPRSWSASQSAAPGSPS